jgi:ATP-dependent Zn protease
MIDTLAYALGGRAAEELVFHEPTTGASNDIEKATALARSMVTEYGMSAKLGAVKYGTSDAQPFMGRDYGHQRDYSEEIAAWIDEEVRGLIEAAHDEAWEILVQYRDVLDQLVLELAEREKLITAYHEGGHALVAAALPATDPVHKVTILPRGRALGYTMVLPDRDKYSQTRSEMLDSLAYMLGGMAAEALIFHDVTSGAGNDIEKATGLARAMVTQYGMTERLGAVKLGDSNSEPFLGRDMGHTRNYSEETAAKVDDEIKALLGHAHQEAFEILHENRDVLDTLVLALLDKETLDKAEIAEIFEALRRRPNRPAWTGSPERLPSTAAAVSSE